MQTDPKIWHRKMLATYTIQDFFVKYINIQNLVFWAFLRSIFALKYFGG